MGQEQIHIAAAAFVADVFERSKRRHVAMQAGVAERLQRRPVRTASMPAPFAFNADGCVGVGQKG